MKMRRILALLLALMLAIIGAVPVFAQESEKVLAASEAVETSEIEELLKRLDILTISDGYASDAVVLRGDFLVMLLKAIGVEAVLTDENRKIFFDVEPDAEIAPVLQIAYNLGIIKGMTDGRFCPEEPITSVEALVMTVRAAGCESIAMEEGGYYTGYLICGKKLGFTDYLLISPDEQMTNREAEQMIFNLLNAKLVIKTSNADGDSIALDRNTSLLKDLYHMVKAEGIVDTNSFASLYGAERCERGKISVNNILYDIDMEYDGRFIGERVVFYYQQFQDGRRDKIIYMYSENAGVYEMPVEDVVSLIPGELIYYDADGKVKQISLRPDAVTLENGIKMSVPEQGYVLPQYGKVKIIKSEADSAASMVVISSVELGVVKSVNGDVVYLDAKNAFYYDIGLYENVSVKDVAGNELTLADIPKQSLAEIQASADKEWMEIVISARTETITVENVREIGGTYPYYELTNADGIKYKTIRDFKNFYHDNKVTVGATYTALFDTSGAVAAFITRAEQYRYGYLYKSTEKSDMFSPKVMLKLYTDAGMFEEHSFADKVKNLSTDTFTTGKALFPLCSEGQVIKYALNSNGEIAAVAFAGDETENEKFRRAGTTPVDNYSEITRYYKETKLFGGLFALGTDTVIFSIPLDKSREDSYHILKPDDIVNQGYYPGAQGYIDGDSAIAKAVVLNDAPRVGRDSARMLVISVAQIYNAETEEQETALIGLVDGKEKTLALASDDVLDCKVRETGMAPDQTIQIDEGDIIRYDLDVNGKVSQILVAFDYSTHTPYGQRKISADAATGTSYLYQVAYGDMDLTWGQDAMHAYGTVTKIQDNTYLRFRWEGAEKEKEYAYPVVSGQTYIYEYDASRKKGSKVRTVTVNDIITLEDNPAVTDKIAMLTRMNAVSMLVIYK